MANFAKTVIMTLGRIAIAKLAPVSDQKTPPLTDQGHSHYDSDLDAMQKS
jgi:hypothetical protein